MANEIRTTAANLEAVTSDGSAGATSVNLQSAVTGGTTRATSAVIQSVEQGGTTRNTSAILEVLIPWIPPTVRATTVILETTVADGGVGATSANLQSVVSGGDVRATSAVIQTVQDGGTTRATSVVSEAVIPWVISPAGFVPVFGPGGVLKFTNGVPSFCKADCCEDTGCVACSGTTPDAWQVDIAGIENLDPAVCSDCDTALNGSFVASIRLENCDWVSEFFDFCGSTDVARVRVRLESDQILVWIEFAGGLGTPAISFVKVQTFPFDCAALSAEDIPYVGSTVGTQAICLVVTPAVITCSLTAL